MRAKVVDRNSGHRVSNCGRFIEWRFDSRFRRWDWTGTAGNQAGMRDTTATGEVGDGLLPEVGRVETARMAQKLFALGAGLRDDLAVGIDDQAASNEWEAVLDAGFGDSHDPRRVLIRAGLHRQTIVEQPLLGTLLAFLGVQ